MCTANPTGQRADGTATGGAAKLAHTKPPRPALTPPPPPCVWHPFIFARPGRPHPGPPSPPAPPAPVPKCQRGGKAVDCPNIVFLIDESTDGRTYREGFAPVQIPNVRKLAAKGVQFDAHYVNAPVCCPSRSSIWAGRYPHKIPHQQVHAHYPAARPLRLQPGPQPHGNSHARKGNTRMMET